MGFTTSFEVSRLIRRLREEAGLTQGDLADRVGTTQSVISRLESDAYAGHSLSMLYRIGAALDRTIVVTAIGEDTTALSVREHAPGYGQAADDEVLAHPELDRLAERLARRFGEHGVTEADVREAIRWARGVATGGSLDELRGAIQVEPGSVVDDVRAARAMRGRGKDRGR